MNNPPDHPRKDGCLSQRGSPSHDVMTITEDSELRLGASPALQVEARCLQHRCEDACVHLQTSGRASRELTRREPGRPRTPARAKDQ